MDPVEHYFRLRENDLPHADAVEHVRLRFGVNQADLLRLLEDYRSVVTSRLIFVSQAHGR